MLPSIPKTMTIVPDHKCEGQLFSLMVLAEEEYHDKEFVDSEEELIVYTNKKLCLRGSSKAEVHWLDGRKQIKKVENERQDVLKYQSNYRPMRSHDHKIPLVPGTQPVNIRPYRHPPVQKDAIESMVKELLEAGLNKNTIKDKFLIPIIEELIDELNGDVIDDILVYNKSLDEHVDHLTAVLTKMRDHNIFAKKSKCVFSNSQVEYLGHVISAQGVATDLAKVQAMQTWPVPKNIKQLKGFLGLTSLDEMAPYSLGILTRICKKQGKDNVVADALSRREGGGWLNGGHSRGLLQPLPILKSVWSSISMDFIEGLPKSQGYNVIFVVVDRLIKYAYFIPLAHPFTAVHVAQAFLDSVCKLHDMPDVTPREFPSNNLAVFV
ncbi:reverse transcriptase [Tanacetum coccineum]